MWGKGDFEMFVATLIVGGGILGAIIGFALGWLVFS